MSIVIHGKTNKLTRNKLNVNTTNCRKNKSTSFDIEYWKYLHVHHNLDVSTVFDLTQHPR